MISINEPKFTIRKLQCYILNNSELSIRFNERNLTKLIVKILRSFNPIFFVNILNSNEPEMHKKSLKMLFIYCNILI